MALMRELSTRSDLAQNWQANQDSGACSFGFSNLGSYRASADALEEKPGKSHPHFQIADWLAASLSSKYDQLPSCREQAATSENTKYRN